MPKRARFFRRMAKRGLGRQETELIETQLKQKPSVDKLSAFYNKIKALQLPQEKRNKLWEEFLATMLVGRKQSGFVLNALDLAPGVCTPELEKFVQLQVAKIRARRRVSEEQAKRALAKYIDGLIERGNAVVNPIYRETMSYENLAEKAEASANVRHSVLACWTSFMRANLIIIKNEILQVK